MQIGLSQSAIFDAVEASLERLGSTDLDVLQIHRFDETVPPAETMHALDCLVRSGKVRYIGASSMWAYQFALLQSTAEKYRYTKFVSMQNQSNLPYREEEREMNRYCNETGWAPFSSGLLVRPLAENVNSLRSKSTKNGAFYEDEDSVATDVIIARVEEVAKEEGGPCATLR
ncbi:unnamed protein product [Parascedosporium putredinis]|uniref:NADP-dependent oxidoreductase domain-containing protein n=1 Tax=Parascedosporium putredinis TaxID=1442378 RepID=A0A9P1MC28_9PEZI|nr:unnamed protein product [Parascedosporium putredinis]CAI7996901.1 unnamed protein product [Parascedosporium putredinis]